MIHELESISSDRNLQKRMIQRLKETNLKVINETLEARERKGKKEMEREWEARDLLPNYNFGEDTQEDKQRHMSIIFYLLYPPVLCLFYSFAPVV